MTTQKSHKARGKGFETDLMKWLRDQGYDSERLALAGSKDEGDLVVKYFQREGYTFDLILEAKAPGAGNKIDLSGWLNEADIEMENYGKAREKDRGTLLRMVIIKARGKGIKDAYVIQRLEDIF